MTRHLRNRDVADGAEHVASAARRNNNEIKDENGIVHTTSRSLRKINYAEIERGFDYLENDEEIETPTMEDENMVVQKDENMVVKKDDDEVHNMNAESFFNDHDNNNVNSENRNNLVNPPEMLTRQNSGRKRKNHPTEDDDDESFHEDDALDEDDDDDEDEIQITRTKNRSQRQRDDNFIVPDADDDANTDDDDDDDDDDAYNYYGRNSRRNRRSKRIRARHTTPPPPPRRSLRSASKRTRQSALSDDDTDDHNNNHLTLADEIRELEEDSPIREKRSLRERTKHVNYTIPPPLTADEYLRQQQQLDNNNNNNTSFLNPSPNRRGRGNMNTGPSRRLFPTGGPFGGNDSVTIFGQNTNFYGLNNSNSNDNNLNNSNNKLILDSDSSDDEILPMGAKPREKSTNKNLPTKKKKKPEIADIDPLGVDMNINFDDVGGLDNYIDQLKEMVALPLLYPELYQNFNIIPPRGVLFHGPPGTGKTLMARALAASCSTDSRKITFFMRKGADILSKWVGEAERQLRLLFEEAKKQQPSIIFFDEIDGLAPVRSSKQEQIHASIVSTLLALMDGMDNRGQVIVIGATNRPDAVDPALRRPGRFDREFYFPLPDEGARAKILSIQTKKWTPPLSDDFISSLAKLTKGYGGADLRALCTEAALFSIQRKFPQIYKSEQKLQVDRSKLRVNTHDFMLALQKIVPSSARSTGNIPEPLPQSVKPLLNDQFVEIEKLLQKILPQKTSQMKRDTSLIQHYIDYEDLDDIDGSQNDVGGIISQTFSKHEFINSLAESRVCKPRLLISGAIGNGQQYIGAAILNKLEHYNVQRLDVASLVSESTRSIESAIVQGFVEARKRQPSVVFIPNLDIWSKTIPVTAVLTLASLFRSLRSNERIFLLGISESLTKKDLLQEPLCQLSFVNNVFNIEKPSLRQRREYFGKIEEILKMKPTAFQLERKRRVPLPKLPIAGRETIPSNLDEEGKLLSPEDVLRRKLKSLQYQDMKLKNVLKIKLSGLMDLVKNRYKRFKKPPVDDAFLVHLFEPQPTDPSWQPAYTKDGDMILEVATSKKYFNMDLDIVEERLWNGFYSEPRQYLKDIELIYIDANTMGDRERIIKASEMFANAQMAIEDISQPEFIKECKAVRKRDLERQQLALKDMEKQNIDEQISIMESKSDGLSEVTTGSGNQVQSQLLEKEKQDNSPETTDVQQKDNHNPSTEVNDTLITGKNTNMNYNEENQEAPDIYIEKREENLELVKEMELGNGPENQKGADWEDRPTADKNDERIDNFQEQTNKLEKSHSDDGITAIDNIVTTDNDVVKVSDSMGNKEDESNAYLSDIDKELIVDQDSILQILKELESMTEDTTVSSLEEVYAGIMDIIWEDRLKWDKTETIKKLRSFVEL